LFLKIFSLEKLKKQRQPQATGSRGSALSTRPRSLRHKSSANFNTYPAVYPDRSSIEVNARVFFRRINHRCGQEKKTECTSSTILDVVPLPNTANSSDVQTEFAAEHNKDEVEGKFRKMNSSPPTKKNTEYCFELFFPFIDIIF